MKKGKRKTKRRKMKRRKKKVKKLPVSGKTGSNSLKIMKTFIRIGSHTLFHFPVKRNLPLKSIIIFL